MTDAVRWYVITTAVVVAVVGTPVLWARWRTYKIENKYLWIAAVLANFAFGWGTAENLVRHLPWGPRTLFTALAEFFISVAVLYHPTEDVRRRWRYRRILIQQRKERR